MLHSRISCPSPPYTVIIGITAVNTVPTAQTIHATQRTPCPSVFVRSAARKTAINATQPASVPPATMWRTSHQLDMPPHIQPITPESAR